MTPNLLIHLIVHQTTILIAQLSTAAGIRAPLGDIAGQMFLDLSRAIEAEGVPRKVVADMFGLALRGYQKKVQRLEESETDRGTSLWEAVLTYVQQEGSVTRHTVEQRFLRDDYRSVAAVLNDLVTSRLLFRTGMGDSALYKSTGDDATQKLPHVGADALSSVAWLHLYREPELTAEALSERLSAPLLDVERALEKLVNENAIKPSGDDKYTALSPVIPVGADEGWAAAVFDHFQTVAAALGTKIRAQAFRSRQNDLIGGTTMAFDIHESHPHREEVLQLLSHMRAETDRLWDKVHAWNEAHPVSEEERMRVSFYFGQSISPLEEDES